MALKKIVARIRLSGLLLMACCYATAQTTNDISLMNAAGNILQAGRYCDSAMKSLQQVSAAGKDRADYLTLMARVYECRDNKEYAEIYYSRAIKAGAGGDSIQQKMARLKDTTRRSTANEDRLEREREKLKNQNVNFRKQKSTNIDDFYVVMSTGYSTMTGGKKAMATNELDFFSVSLGWPIMDDKFLLDFNAMLGVVWGRNPGWYETPAYRANPVPVGDGLGIVLALEPSMNYVLINSRRHTITAGGILGGHLIANDAWTQKANGEVSSTGQNYFCIGPRVAYYGWKHLYISAQYLHLGFRTIKAAVAKNAELVPVNLDQWRLNVGVRFSM